MRKPVDRQFKVVLERYDTNNNPIISPHYTDEKTYLKIFGLISGKHQYSKEKLSMRKELGRAYEISVKVHNRTMMYLNDLERIRKEYEDLT